MQWWVVWTMASQSAGQISARIVQAASKPDTKGKTVWQVWGPYPSKAAAQQAEDNRDPGSAQLSAGAASQAGTPKIPGASELASVGSFLGKLGEASLWLRAAEITIGILLIAVGVAKITSVLPIAEKIAGAVK